MNTVRYAAVCCIFVVGLATSGCGFSYLADRESNPIIQDYVTPNVFSAQSVDMFGTTASRRMVLVKQDKNSESYVTTCAEPPPDVGEAFAAAIATGMRGAANATQGTDTTIGAELAGQYARQVTTEIAPLIYRTQGLQLYRDAQFGLCIDRLNGDLPKEEYEQAKRDRFNRALELIRFEIPYMKEASVEYFKSVQAGENKIDIDKLKALLEAAKVAPFTPAPAPSGG